MDSIELKDKFATKAIRLHAGWIGHQVAVKHPKKDLILVGEVESISFKSATKRKTDGSAVKIVKVKLTLSDQKLTLDQQSEVSLVEVGGEPEIPRV